MSRLGAAALAALAALSLASGCRRDLCEGRAPAFEVEVRLAREDPTIRRLRVRGAAAGLKADELLEVGGKLTDGWTAFSVSVGEPGSGGFGVDLELAAVDDRGRVVARGELHVAAAGNACNFFTVTLAPFAAEPGVDSGRADASPRDTGRRDLRRPDLGPVEPHGPDAAPPPPPPVCAPACGAYQVCCRVSPWGSGPMCISVGYANQCLCDPATGVPCEGQLLYRACCRAASGEFLCSTPCKP